MTSLYLSGGGGTEQKSLYSCRRLATAALLLCLSCLCAQVGRRTNTARESVQMTLIHDPTRTVRILPILFLHFFGPCPRLHVAKNRRDMSECSLVCKSWLQVSGGCLRADAQRTGHRVSTPMREAPASRQILQRCLPIAGPNNNTHKFGAWRRLTYRCQSLARACFIYEALEHSAGRPRHHEGTGWAALRRLPY